MAAKADDAKTTITLENVRLSFPHLDTPQPAKADDDGVVRGQPKYNGAFLMKKTDTKNIGRVKEAAKHARIRKWGADEKQWPKLKAEKLCLRDGDEEDFDGYAGHMYLTASNTEAVGLVDRRGRTITKPGVLYAGCYVNVIVNIWAQDNKHGKRINASLEAVQFVKDGDSFGRQRIDATKAFSDLGSEDGDDGIDDDDAGGDDDNDLI